MLIIDYLLINEMDKSLLRKAVVEPLRDIRGWYSSWSAHGKALELHTSNSKAELTQTAEAPEPSELWWLRPRLMDGAIYPVPSVHRGLQISICYAKWIARKERTRVGIVTLVPKIQISLLTSVMS